MNDRKRVLILGGTGEAAKLAAIVSELAEIEVISSLAGRTQTPIVPTGSVRVGGFGGELGLVKYLRDQQIDYLIDATHPFAAKISWSAAAAAIEAKIPHLMLVRPAWEQTSGDRWIEVDHVEAAATVLETDATRVFLTIGRQQLAAFARLQNLWFLMRSIDPPVPEMPVPPGITLLDRGPFTVEQERKLLTNYNIDKIVSKNSGGNATYAKVIAAREMGIAIVMVKRPAMPIGERVSEVNDAIDWLKNWL